MQNRGLKPELGGCTKGEVRVRVCEMSARVCVNLQILRGLRVKSVRRHVSFRLVETATISDTHSTPPLIKTLVACLTLLQCAIANLKLFCPFSLVGSVSLPCLACLFTQRSVGKTQKAIWAHARRDTHA